MPDFSVRFSAGVTPTIWDDHPVTVSRLNARPTRPPKYQRASVGVQVEVRATWAGSEAPMDADLGGNLFASDFAESPGASPIATSPVGQSSVQRFTPTAAGHYLWMIRHADGGAIGLHLDAEA